MKANIASNTIYLLADSIFAVDTILVSNVNTISFVGKGKNQTFLEGIAGNLSADTLNWNIMCFDLQNADNIQIKNLQIRRYRGFGIRADAYSSYFYASDVYLDSCGWYAWGEGAYPEPPVMEIRSPGGIKLLGDFGTLRKSFVINSGWDGVQVGGHEVLIDSTNIIGTGRDTAGAKHQGDGIHLFRNPDVFYLIDGDTLWKSGYATVRKCSINTVEIKKSGIEAGYIDSDTQKPLLKVSDSYIAGGKGIGITQDANPYESSFFTTVENCTIVNLMFDHYPIRIEFYDDGTDGQIEGNVCLCPANYPDGQCPVGEFDTDPNAVNYERNKWKIGAALQDSFCVDQNLDYFED